MALDVSQLEIAVAVILGESPSYPMFDFPSLCSAIDLSAAQVAFTGIEDKQPRTVFLGEGFALHVATPTCVQRLPLRIFDMHPLDTPYCFMRAIKSGGAFLIASMSSGVSFALPLRSPRLSVP